MFLDERLPNPAASDAACRMLHDESKWFQEYCE